MSEHVATVAWQRGDQTFVDNRYHRAHRWTFDGGAEVAASSSPSVVRPPLSDPAGVDPEEAFVASLSSCHMLWFLFFAAQAKHLVDSYEDAAVGTIGKTAAGKTGFTRVTLRPRVTLAGGGVIEADELKRLHHEAHAHCFIANSVTAELVVEPR
ncbi:MAG TPA: OsmC family protein [Polyangiaceae bacterium]|nr:OsmC family protein [Polyangiaceae bacterium]